ncbi:retrotransposon protein, putative, ty1-copia subclass [Tanacetum coccineum]|uniref:Retrotransposon protein, putative, ty1-copia subclass n=1 Tax=Tanacetum coccineum TaxID=301880 RepID=A0ABQ5B9L3_9ASTR
MDENILLVERLAARLQEEEREQFSIDEQARFLVETIAERKRFFAAQRAEQIRNKPPTKTQLRNKMITFLKNMGRFTYNQLKNKSLEEIQKLYEREQKWINDFVPMDSEMVKDSGKKDDDSQKQAESSKKRPRAEHDEESVKKQKLEDDAEKEELRACLDIVPGDDIAINVESLATKYPIIFSEMLDDFDRQDVVDLCSLVKESYKCIQGGSVLVGYNASYKIKGIGSIQVKMFDGAIRTLEDVRHVLGMKRNLISLSTLDLKGYKYSGEGGVLKVTKGSMIMMKADIKSANLYQLRGTTIIGNATVTTKYLSVSDSTNLWHMRLGHMSQAGLTELSKRGLLDAKNIGILDYVHSDIWGPSQEESLGGARYMLTIIDDYSRRVRSYFLKHKSQAFTKFKEWKVMVKKQTVKKVKKLCIDNGMEFCSNEFNSYCKPEGIVRHYNIPYTPQQNGVAKRMNRTIISKARCMLSNAGLSKRFSAEAALTACYLINMSPSTAIDKKIPIEVWSNSPANYEDLRVFGCIAYTHANNRKLDPRAIKCIFLGYKSGVKGYKLWCPETKKKTSVQVEELVNQEHTSSGHFGDQDIPIVEEDSGVDQQPQRFIATQRPRRTTKAPSRLIEEVNLIAYALNVAKDIEGNMEPSTYSKAIISTKCNKWLTAMHNEMESLDKNGTWELVKFPEEKKPIKCKWIFKIKEGITLSEDVRFKARLMAKGFSQIPSIDFTDVFSPVVKHSSIRTLLSIVAMNDYKLEQLDVKTAFCMGN